MISHLYSYGHLLLAISMDYTLYKWGESVLLTGKRAITATVPGLISSLAPGTTLAPRWLHQGPVGPAARQADAGEVGPGNCAGNIT